MSIAPLFLDSLVVIRADLLNQVEFNRWRSSSDRISMIETFDLQVAQQKLKDSAIMSGNFLASDSYDRVHNVMRSL